MSPIGRLRSLLGELDPVDELQEGYRAGIFRLLDEAGSAALDRDHWSPGHITVGGIILSQEAEAVLLVFHSRLGRWVQPGGHIERADLDVESGARREVAEEVGLVDLEPLGIAGLSIHQIPARAEEPPHSHFDVRFGYRLMEGLPRRGEGIEDLCWVRVQDLSRWPTDRSVRHAVAMARLAVGSV
ncbi:MAG TPA: NUDIX domain-containing protein [Acidimicrobiia bacterium]